MSLITYFFASQTKHTGTYRR